MHYFKTKVLADFLKDHSAGSAGALIRNTISSPEFEGGDNLAVGIVNNLFRIKGIENGTVTDLPIRQRDKSKFKVAEMQIAEKVANVQQVLGFLIHAKYKIVRCAKYAYRTVTGK